LGVARKRLDRFEITLGIGKDAWCCPLFRAAGVQKRFGKMAHGNFNEFSVRPIFSPLRCLSWLIL
jgi:hypothetical protein